MMKLAVFVLLVGYAAASGLVSSQRAVIYHHTPHGYGSGVSSRYFDKSIAGVGLGLYGLGYGAGLGGYGAGLGGYGAGLGGYGAGLGGYGGYLGGYRSGYLGGYGAGYLGGYGGLLGGYGGNAYDGRDNLGLAYNNYDLGGARLGLF